VLRGEMKASALVPKALEGAEGEVRIMLLGERYMPALILVGHDAADEDVEVDNA